MLKPFTADLPGVVINITSLLCAGSNIHFILIFHTDGMRLLLYMMQTYCCILSFAFRYCLLAGICNIPSCTWLLSYGYNFIASCLLVLFKPVAEENLSNFLNRQGRIITRSVFDDMGWTISPRSHLLLSLSHLDLLSKKWAYLNSVKVGLEMDLFSCN